MKASSVLKHFIPSGLILHFLKCGSFPMLIIFTAVCRSSCKNHKAQKVKSIFGYRVIIIVLSKDYEGLIDYYQTSIYTNRTLIMFRHLDFIKIVSK